MTEDTAGLEARYDVRKINDPTGKHGECRYFVLDPQHDPIAREVLSFYATFAQRDGCVALADDLRSWLALLTPAPASEPLGPAAGVSLSPKAAQTPTPAPEAAINETPFFEDTTTGEPCGRKGSRLCTHDGPWRDHFHRRITPAPTPPTTVQADRDAGQVRLTDEAVAEVIHKACGDFLTHVGAWRAAQAVTGLLAARQSDPDATERVREALERIRDDSTTPMNTAADIDQMLVELLANKGAES